MKAILERCAGLDVHKRVIWACVLLLGKDGTVKKFIRSFGAMTRDLLALSDFLAEHGVTDVAMESTGVYWKPVYNILEGSFRVLLCNAQHLKRVPGRKTDVKDSEWLAELVMCGLLKGSFVPPRPLREMRDLTRHRAQLTAERAREVQRIEKIFEDANIKLGAVATDILGESGRDMLNALIAGEEDAKKMAELARGRLRSKIPQLQEALHGHVTEHHRFMLKLHYEHVLYVEGLLKQVTDQIGRLIDTGNLDPTAPKPDVPESEAPAAPEDSPLPFEEAANLADEIPGINRHAAEDILAETGTDMRQFPSERHLASWTKMCPGNDESAGKRKNARTGKGNRWLKRVMTQVGWAAARTKDTYFHAQFCRIAKRRGKKRAVLAVAHTILGVLYHMLKYHRHYQELGADFFDQLDPERVTRYHVGRLEDLGYNVTLTKAPVAA